MHIKEVLENVVVAIFSDAELSKQLVLKGGFAMNLLEKIDERLSTDIDLSYKSGIDDPKHFSKMIKKALSAQFKKYKYDIIDMTFSKKPKRNIDKPAWWGGWLCEFKLSSAKDRKLSDSQRTRQALIPEGVVSSKIEIEISEHEYWGSVHKAKIKRVGINGYSRTMLVVEKIRALCQQHPDYPYALPRNRTRDIVDIYYLTKDHLTKSFIEECKQELPKSFAIKEVNESLLDAFFDEDYIEMLRKGFPQVIDTLKGKHLPFETYLEHLRYLIKSIHP